MKNNVQKRIRKANWLKKRVIEIGRIRDTFEYSFKIDSKIDGPCENCEGKGEVNKGPCIICKRDDLLDKDIPIVQIMQPESGIEYKCFCRHHSTNIIYPNKLCSYLLAVILYLGEKNGKHS